MPKRKEQLPIVLACVIHDGCVLFVRREAPDQPELHGYLELPGGKVEFGEDPARAAERETLEETGVVVRAQEMLPFPYWAVRRYADHLLHSVVLCFRCDFLLSPGPDPTTATPGSEWRAISELDPLTIQSGSLQFIEHVLKVSGYSHCPAAIRAVPCIALTSIDHRQNRRRVYNITVEASLGDVSHFLIKCSWGRDRAFRQSVKEFTHRDEALQYVERVLSERKAHNYQLLYKTDDFPNLSVLNNIPVAQPSQLGLF